MSTDCKEFNESCKALAKEKTKNWIIGETCFRYLGAGFCYVFKGVDENGFVLGESWLRKTKKTEYFKHQMTPLKDIKRRDSR
jgi:hypothetical protein